MRLVAAALIAVLLAPAAGSQTAPVLQLQGQPYSQGAMTLHLTADAGVPSLLFYGLNPLDPPLQTTKGPFFVGTVFNVIFSGIVPSEGRIDLPFTLPPLDPSLAGIPMVMQGMVPGSLTNPATLPLDQPYFEPQDAIVIPNPNPTQGASFGDTVAVGDLNADGVNDLVVGAWFEAYQGVHKAGSVYVLWGPDFSQFLVLRPDVPVPFGTYGASVTVADFTGDGIADLLVAETPKDPPDPVETAFLHIFEGGASFDDDPEQTISIAGAGAVLAGYGRLLSVGDFDGDGTPDIAVSNASESVAGKSQAGSIDVHWGPDYSAKTVVQNPTPAAGDFFGSRLEACDVNGDGIDDLVEGSGRTAVGGLTMVGEIHVFLGPDFSLHSTIPNPLGLKNARFAEGLHVADLNGDGFPEIVAADVKNRLFIFWGPDWSSYSMQKRPPTLFQNPFGETVYGEKIASLDANGDGILDLAICDYFNGALPGCFPGQEGTVYICLGPFYSTYLPFFEPQPACGDGFSFSLATVDVNGDGLAEILAGSPTAEVGPVINGGKLSILKP